MPWLWIPPRGKLERKAAFSSCCGDEATTYYDRAFRKMALRVSGGRTPRASFEPTRPAIDPYKSLGRERCGVWGGGSLSPERFPLPSPIFPNFPYPRPLNCRLSPTLMVTRSRSKYSRSGMTYLRERPPESSLNPAGSRSSWEVNHACIRALSS